MAVTTVEERVRIWSLVKTGHTDAQIAEQLGCCLTTVRKWRRRAHREGLPGLASRMGRPATGAMSMSSETVRGVVQVLRDAHPGWGPLTLCAELENDPALKSRKTPSRATIARWVHERGLSRSYQRHRELPQPDPCAAKEAHEAWELDARGHECVPDVGVITLINLVDRFSKAKLLSYPCCLGQQQATRHADTEDYQLALRLAASEWGLPDRLYVDRDSVFYDNQSPSPFPTRFHLWMLALGVDVVFGPPGQPTERAMVERNHQTWDRQVLQGQSYREWVVLRDALRQRRDFLNRCLPCASCGGRPPLVAHPETGMPRREYHPEWELQMLDMARVHTYLGQGQWFRKVSNVGTVSLAQQIYTVSRRLAKAEVPITFEPGDQHLVFNAPDGEIAKRLPIKGLTPLFIMGHQGPVPHLDGVQPVLPFITPLPRGDATS